MIYNHWFFLPNCFRWPTNRTNKGGGWGHMCISGYTGKRQLVHRINFGLMIMLGDWETTRANHNKTRWSFFFFETWSAFTSRSQSLAARLSSSWDCGENTENWSGVWTCACRQCGWRSVMRVEGNECMAVWVFRCNYGGVKICLEANKIFNKQ